jgi:hypothetical protein|tara:strand:+ start:1257 stop:1514 length:258 start_codon:yes stop_codon:yes gene_type:complete
MAIRTAREEIIYNAKTNKILALKDNCKKQLEKTDWYVVRNFENNEPIPDEIKEQRVALRLKCNEKEIEINSLESDYEIVNFNIDL